MFSGLRWSPSQRVSSVIVSEGGLREYISRNTFVLIKLYFQSQASGLWVNVFYPSTEHRVSFLVLVGLPLGRVVSSCAIQLCFCVAWPLILQHMVLWQGRVPRKGRSP